MITYFAGQVRVGFAAFWGDTLSVRAGWPRPNLALSPR